MLWNIQKLTIKHEKRKVGGYAIGMLALLLVFSGCSDQTLTGDQLQKAGQEISKIDGRPIVTIQAADLYESELLDQYRDQLAAHHGRSVVRALNEQTRLKSLQEGRSVAVKDLGRYAHNKAGVPDIGSSHIRITDPDGDTEDFVLTLRQYVDNPQKAAAKGSGGPQQLSAATTYLALSPDRFYLEDDENGNEQWPVTFPAVSMDDPADKIEVTFNKDGFVSSTLSGTAKAKGNDGQPDLVFAEATPVIGPNIIEPCEEYDPRPICQDPPPPPPGDGGDDAPGNNNPGCTEHAYRGNTGGSRTGTQTYFDLLHLRLYATGDGDGAAELQMFIRNDDDYAGECLNREYKYRFDTVYRRGQLDTRIVGADGAMYWVPDVNLEDVDYSLKELSVFGNPIRTAQGFPLFDLTNRPGPWRFVLSDDDKDYKDFTHRREHEWGQDIETYDMSTGTWSEVFTGFSTHRIKYGSSDDPIQESGVRRITKQNVEERTIFIPGFGDVVKARKDYSGPGGYFEIVFGLQAY